MNILNILGIVSAGQKNVAAGQVSSVSTTAPEQRSLFLPMLLQLFAGSATKTKMPAFSQEPLNETMQPSNDSRQTAKLVANHLCSSNNSTGTGLEFLTNGIAPLGAVFATIQNMQLADEPKAVSYDAEVGMKSGLNSERTSATQSLSTEAADDSRIVSIEEGVVSVVSDTPQNAEPASPDAQVAANNLPTAAGIPQMGIGEISLNGSLPLTGFEFTKSGVSPTISETVQRVSAAGATAQPKVEADSHIDAAAKTLAPTLAATRTESDDFQPTDLRQPPVRSTDLTVKLPQNESTGNQVAGSSAISSKPTVQLGNVETSVALPENDSSSNRFVVSVPASPSLRPTIELSDVKSSVVLPQNKITVKSAVVADSSPTISSSSPKPMVPPSDVEANVVLSQSKITVNSAVVANPSPTESSPSSKPTAQLDNAEANAVLAQNESSSIPVAVPSSPSLKPTIQLGDEEPAMVSQNSFPGVALPKSIKQSSDGKTTVDTKTSTNDVDQTKHELSTLNLSDVESVLPLGPEVSSKSAATKNALTPKSVATQRPEILSSIPEGSLSPKASVVGAQSENLGRKDIAAVPANELFQPAEPSSLTSSLLFSNSKPAPTSDTIKSTAELIPSEIHGNRAQENTVNTTSTTTEPVSFTVPLITEAVDVVPNAPMKDAVVSVSKEASLERTSSAAQTSVAVPPAAASVTSPGMEVAVDIPQMGIGETSLNGTLPLTGFDFTKRGVSSTNSETVQSPSPAGAKVLPTVEPDLRVAAARTLAPTLAATRTESDDFQLTDLRQPPVRSADSSVKLPQDGITANPVVVAVPPSPASPSLNPTIQSGDVALNVVLPQNESSSIPVAVPSSPSLKPTIQLGDIEPTLVSQNSFPGVALPNPIQQSGVGKTMVDTKAPTNDVGQNKGESSALNLSDVESVLPLGPEVSSKTVATENIHTPKSLAMQRPEVLSSIPEGSLSPKASVIGPQSENAGRKDITAVPANHPDAKGRVEKGQETDIQGTAKGDTVAIRETVKNESGTGSGKNSNSNELFQPPEKIAAAATTTPDSNPLQAPAETPATKTEAALPLTPNVDNKNLSISATQAELLTRMTSQLSGLHNQPIATLRQEPSVQNAAAPLPTQSDLLPGNLEQTIMDQVSKNLATNLNNNSSEVRIAMKPESLGEVVMKVKMDDGKVSAQIDVNNVNVKAVLDANVSQLRDTLLSKGIEVQRIEIVADGQAAFGSSSGQNNPKQKSQQRGTSGVDALGQYESLRTMGYNTIELIM